MKYAVTSKFYDNGHVSTSGVLTVPDDTQDFERVTATCDVYFNVFATKQEALEYIKECANA